MEAMEALLGRRSVRSFQTEPVAKTIIEDIVDAGRLAPSANNVQPWEFVVVTDSGKRAAIAAMTDYGRFIADAPVCIAVFCKDTKYYIEDGSAAVENILLAAEAKGLGACWVAGDKKSYAGKVGKLLGAPADQKLVALLPMGIAAGPKPKPRKRPLKDVLHWEQF